MFLTNSRNGLKKSKMDIFNKKIDKKKRVEEDKVFITFTDKKRIRSAPFEVFEKNKRKSKRTKKFV